MTVYEFKVLLREEQAKAVWQRGVHLDTRMTGTYKIMLWQLESFYVEMFYNYKDDKIEKIRSFLSTEPLKPYLQQIDITQLFQ